ncbi:MAG: chemical-damaging agent resistance protein C [Micavibrio sp.]|nr:chemical-damaging agent resistance protein C [Micavibrio sp.]|tara:strand:+ start:2636 stop:3220 length:585 start_codon:yes stop_codon:yes gene_type:complete
MSETINKQESKNLTQLQPGLKKLMVGTGWDIQMNEDGAVDVDLSCFLLNVADQTREDSDFVFYNNATSKNEAVRYKGDNRTGAGEGDDEIIFLELDKIDFDVATIVFVASIYEGSVNKQDFGMLKNSYIRVLDEENRVELLRYDLAEDFKGHQAVKIASLERAGNDWYFKALGEPVRGGLAEVAKGYGMLITGA